MYEGICINLYEHKIAIILLNWNGSEDTIECIESLKNITYPNYDIYLVDNNSKIDSINKIKNYLDNDSFYNVDTVTSSKLEFYNKSLDINFLFILNELNEGFAGGNNVAIQYIINNDLSDYVLLLNNDTIVSSDFLNALYDKITESNLNGFVGINTYYYDNKKMLQTVGGGIVDLVHGECNAILDCAKNNISFDFITGSCILMPIDVITKIGLMNTNFFMYWEDVDWSTTAREYNFELKVADYGCIYHKEGASITSYSRLYYHTRNRIYYMKRHTGGVDYYKFLIYIVLYVLREVVVQLIRKNMNFSKALLKGLIDGFLMIMKFD